MRPLLIAVVLVWTACGQTVVQPIDLPAVEKLLANRQDERTLRCDVQPSKAELNFGMRFQAGYILSLPLVQYSSTVKHTWRIALEITPDGGEPTYLADDFHLFARVNPFDYSGETTGAFLIGEGAYDVDFAAVDEQDRVCRKQWRLEAAIGRGGRAVKVAIPPHSVRDLSWLGAPAEPRDTPSPRTLTILMNGSLPYFGPLPSPGSHVIVPHIPGPQIEFGSMMDYRPAILGILESLLERLPGTRIRLVIFDLDQGKETLRQDGFTLKDMGKAAHAANNLDHWTVTVGELQEQRSPWALLERLMQSEIYAQKQSDAVLILGPRMEPFEKMPAHLFPKREKDAKPPLFYMQYRLTAEPVYYSAPRNMANKPADETMQGAAFGADPRPTPDVSDPVELLVARLKGKILQVHSPTEFTKALDAIRR